MLHYLFVISHFKRWYSRERAADTIVGVRMKESTNRSKTVYLFLITSLLAFIIGIIGILEPLFVSQQGLAEKYISIILGPFFIVLGILMLILYFIFRKK